MDKRQRDHDYKPDTHPNHVHTQEREQELARVEELHKDICDLMMDDVLQVGSDSWLEAVKKIGELQKICVISIKAQYK